MARAILVWMGSIWTASAVIAAEPGAGGEAPLRPEVAMRRSREALDSSWRYPWYDASTDELRRIKLPRRWNWEWPDWNGSLPNASVLRTALWTIVVLVAAILIYALTRVYLRRSVGGAGSLAKQAAARGDDASRVEELPVALDPNRGDFLEAARSYYQRGDFNRAIIYLYSHQLLELDRRHLIRLTRGKTNRQYLGELGPHPRLKGLLGETMVAFEDAYFGDHRLTRDRFETCWNRLDDFVQLARVLA
jgi:hypothetical protein